MRLPDGLIIQPAIAQIDDRSTFELPVVIQAKFNHLHKVHIGCFTGIYGGKIGHCTIGRYCSIASEVDIASDQHPSDWLSSSMIQYVPNLHGWGDWLTKNNYNYITPNNQFNSNRPAMIGNDVWIGQGVFIKSGVNIGDGAIIAAHSVVTEDIPAFSIAAGVPAKVKKYRFNDATIERIKSIKWWNYNISEIQDIRFDDINLALNTLEELIAKDKLKQFNPKIVYYKDIK